jgi:hypothetical protein
MRSRSQAAQQPPAPKQENGTHGTPAFHDRGLSEEGAVALAGAARRTANVTVGEFAAVDRRLVEGRPGPKGYSDKPSEVGDWVEATAGKELFFPIKFQSFEVGPITVGVHTREGETYATAFMRASLAAEELFEAEFEVKLRGFADRVKRAREVVGDGIDRE